MLSRLVSSSIIILFFKQKTAYEMRISDWSSDVCSSDLYRPLSGRPEQAICPVRPAQFAFPRSGRREPRYRHDAEGRRHRSGEVRGDGEGYAHRARIRQARDRTSVGSGKSVAVRVDLGGRGHIRIKKTLRKKERTQK